MTLLDGSSHSTLKVKLAASNARMAASSLPHVPIYEPLPRTSVASAFQSFAAVSPQPTALPSTLSERGSRSPATSPARHPSAPSVSALRPSPSASKETLSIAEDSPAVRKERARLDKQDKQRQKQEKKAEQKAAKEERRQSKKVEKEASKREQEQQEAELKSRVAEEQQNREAVQAVSLRAASSAVQVHSPPPSLGGNIVDELSEYLAASSLIGITQHLDQQFEQMLNSKRTRLAAAQPVEYVEDSQPHSQPPPGFAALSHPTAPLSSLLLTPEDDARAARIDFNKLDRAMANTHQQPPPNSQQQQQPASAEDRKAELSSEDGAQREQHDEEEDDDYQRYQQQQAAHLVPDDGEYEQIAEKATDDGKGEPDATDAQDSGDWEDQLDADNDDGKRDANDLDIGALNLQDVTEDEIILAMVREFEAKQAEHGLTHDVSTADMAERLRTYLLDQEEQGPAGFDRQSAREKRRQQRANETEDERRRRKEAKYKQRAQDAAEGILDWDWSSDSDTSASEDESGDEEGEDGEEEDEDEEIDEDGLEASEDDKEEDEDEEDASEDEDDASTTTLDKGARAAVCTCFKPLSAHDPAIIAAQLDSFVASDVDSHHTHHSPPLF